MVRISSVVLTPSGTVGAKMSSPSGGVVRGMVSVREVAVAVSKSVMVALGEVTWKGGREGEREGGRRRWGEWL